VGRRARGLALLGAAAACAGLAASSVSRYTNDVRAEVGPLVPVVVAGGEIRAGTLLTADRAEKMLEQHRVPLRYAPSHVVDSVVRVVGYRITVALHRGDYVSDSTLAAGGETSPSERSGGRAIEITVAGAGSLANALRPNTHVDVLITTDRGGGSPRTYLALQDAELLGFSPASRDAGDTEAAKATATLRVSLRQAVLLTAAQNFARELRLVPRPSGDRSRLSPIGVSASGLGP
jgi:pilus assembly protein CpaB